MPDIDFPVNPSLNATYSKDGKTWIWDGSRWRTNNILSYSGGGTGYASYTTGDLLVGTGNSILKFPVGQNNFQYLRVDSVNSASGVTWISLPLAGSGQSGLVSTLDQTFAGTKTFSSSIIGNLSGTASTSQNINTVAATTGIGHYLLFSPINGGSGVAVSSDAQLQFSPSTNVLTVDTFSGNLSRNDATATNFYGKLTGNVTGTATTSQNINTNVYTNNSVHYVTFTSTGNGAGAALSTSNSAGKLTYRPADEQLSVTNITGTAFTATNFYGTLSGNVTGTATSSQNVNTAAFTNNNVHYLTFTLQGNGAGAALSTSNVAGKLTYRPSDEQLSVTYITGTAFTATNLTGTLTGNVTGNLTGTATTSQNVNTAAFTNNSVHYLTFTLTGSGSGAALSTSNSAGKLTYRPSDEQLSVTYITGTAFTANNLYGTLTGNVTGNVTGTATTSQNINTNVYTNNSVHYLTFTLIGNGAGAALSTSNSVGKLTYRPADEQLSVTNLTGTAFTATNFYGTLTGNVTGTATSAQNVNTAAFTNNNVHFLTFTLQGNGSGAALSTSNVSGKLTYRPTDEQLSVTYITGTAFTATNLTGTILTSSQTNITALGTITTGTWNATAISTAKGGTGQDFSSASGLIKLSSGTASNIANPTAASIGISYLTADTNGNIHWKDNTQVYNGLQYDIAYYNRTGQGVTGTNGVLTYYDVENTKAITVTSNFSGAFNVRDTANNNRFTVDVQNNKTYFSGNSADHELRIYNSNQSSYAGFKANSTGTITYILPPGKPSTGSSILQSDDSGNMIWVPMTGGLSSAITSINSQTGPAITLQTGSSGTDFAISQSANTITFDLPNASATNRGVITTGTQTIAGSKTFSSTISGNLSGTATTSQNINTNVYTNNSVHYLTFTLIGSGAGAALSTSNSAGKLTYRPADEQLSVSFITGTAFTATNLTGTLFGNVTGNLTGTATSSQNVNTNVYTNNNVHYLTFTLQGNGAGAALSTSNSAGKLTYRPADEQLSVTNITGTAFTATNFYGTLTGNVSGTATTSQNVNVNTTTINQNHYLIFSNRSSGSGVALTASTVGIGFTVNPAENTLSAGLFAGNISGTGATFARATFTDSTEATDQLTGSVTFAGGIAVNKKVFAQSVETNGNVVVNGNFQTYGSIIQLGNSGAADTIGFICKIQSVMLPKSNNAFDIGLNDGTHAWKNAAFAGHGTFANLYGSTLANLTGVEFSSGDILVKTGKSIKFYEATDVYNTSIKANSSIAGNYTYTLPLATPGTGASILQSDTSGNMLWVKAASNKATYVLSFGAGFTPTTGLDSVSISIPYANDGSTSLTYTIKRVEVRTETEPGASGLAFYFERHTAGNATWTLANTIKGAASANFSVAQNNYSAAFTTITSSSGNNGEVSSGNYLRVNFASVGSAANVSISIMIQEN